MSDNVMSTGFMAILRTPLNDEDREEKGEWLWEQESNLHINYEGTMVYSDNRSDGYGLTIHTGKTQGVDAEFVIACEKMGLDIELTSIRGYSCYWYNGVDSDMGMLTVEQYKERIA